MWDAIGQDDKLAAVIGINVYGHKLASFVLSSTIAGLAGVIFAHFMTYISPYDFTFFFAMQLIIYVIFGGAATIYGPLIGVGVLVTISEALRKVGSYEVIFYGFTFLIVLRFFPQGIVSFISQLIESRRNLTNTTAVDPSNPKYS
jgi:branched-chain amino acid transport system permease protein